MSEPSDQELEALLAELAPAPAERLALLEAHRQLEKDLLRLADPAPPADFVSRVMARVAQAPARTLSRGEVWSAALILMSSMALAAVALVASGGSFDSLGLALASQTVWLREALVALQSGLHALWATAALPIVLGLCVLLAAALTAFKKMLQPAAVKAVP